MALQAEEIAECSRRFGKGAAPAVHDDQFQRLLSGFHPRLRDWPECGGCAAQEAPLSIHLLLQLLQFKRYQVNVCA